MSASAPLTDEQVRLLREEIEDLGAAQGREGLSHRTSPR